MASVGICAPACLRTIPKGILDAQHGPLEPIITVTQDATFNNPTLPDFDSVQKRKADAVYAFNVA